MSLPNVGAWLTDYRTASAVFASKNNARIDHFITLCTTNSLFICMCERTRPAKAALRDDGLAADLMSLRLA